MSRQTDGISNTSTEPCPPCLAGRQIDPPVQHLSPQSSTQVVQVTQPSGRSTAVIVAHPTHRLLVPRSGRSKRPAASQGSHAPLARLERASAGSRGDSLLETAGVSMLNGFWSQAPCFSYRTWEWSIEGSSSSDPALDVDSDKDHDSSALTVLPCCIPSSRANLRNVDRQSSCVSCALQLQVNIMDCK